jgi:L,D-transpeptidase catalytic domain/Putative peptidoglycan binding domain
VASVAMISGVLAGTCALGYGVSRVTSDSGPTDTAVRAVLITPPSATPSTATSTPQLAPQHQVTAPLPSARPQQVAQPGPRLLGAGDHGPRVRDLQARLRQIAWYFGNVSDDWDRQTTAALKGFQDKREIAETGYVDQRTLNRLHEMTRTPTKDELANRLPGDLHTDARLDPRCLSGRAMCIDKESSTVRWVVDGKVLRTMAVRFGASYTPTREGLFHIGWKSRDHVSHLYDSSMPFAMFFSGGQAVHYSSDFAARGYLGASHGCVNVRDYAGIQWLFGQVAIGDKVVVYWS